jgi:hypothetical protein
MNKEKMEQILKFCDEIATKKLGMEQSLFESVLEFSHEFSRKYDEVTPFHHFLIELVLTGMHETNHSRFLHKLLSYKNKKGEHPILESFCNTLLNFGLTITNPTIEREKDNIDISVHDKDYFLIIENKINNAQDQPNQLARYINTAKEKMNDIKKIYICYLPGSDSQEPEENSWENPAGNPKSYKSTFKGRFKIKPFKSDVSNWLNRLEVNDEKKYLQAALEQYAYLIENK